MRIDSTSIEVKKAILKAIQAGKLTKADLLTMKIDEVSILLSRPHPLISVKMGDIQSFRFNNEDVTEQEFERLTKIADALGVEQFNGVARWNINVIDTGFPLANNENDIII